MAGLRCLCHLHGITTMLIYLDDDDVDFIIIRSCNNVNISSSLLLVSHGSVTIRIYQDMMHMTYLFESLFKKARIYCSIK